MMEPPPAYDTPPSAPPAYDAPPPAPPAYEANPLVPTMSIGDAPQATVVAIHGNPEAATIAAGMPVVVGVADIADVGAADEPPVAVVTACTTTTGAYYTPEQLAIMNEWAPPADRPNVEDGPIVLAPVVGVEPPAVPAGVVVGVEPAGLAPQLTAAAPFVTASGVPMVPPAAARSPAETHSDGWQGVKSCDECLDTVDALLLFLQTHNTRPQVGINVEGYHMEKRTRTVRDSEGRERRETYEVKVTDFEYTVDVTNFCFPMGYIQSDEAAAGKDLDGDGVVESVADICDGYLKDENLLATLVMEKRIKGFNFDELCHYVRRHIRYLGWNRRLSVSTSVNNRIVRVYKENACSSLWENMCCFVLMHVTILPCMLFRCYRDCGGHRATGISSIFRMSNGVTDYEPLQVFDVVRPALWCTGWRNAHFAQMLLHQQVRWS